MAIRAREAAGAAKTERPTEYIREAAGCSPAQEIADAKTLLDAGTITHRNSTRSKPKRSARPDSSSARQSSGYGRTTIRSGALRMAPLKFEIRPTRRARELLDSAIEQRATPAESSAVQGDFTEPRIAVGPER